MDTDDGMEAMDTIDDSSPPTPPPLMHTTVKMGPDGEPILLSYTPLHSPFCQQVSPQEYRHQATVYTQEAVAELKASAEYKKHVEKCHSCGVVWYEGHVTLGCKECGGYAMTRQCPICKGVCGRQWKRVLDLSHSNAEAHWDGDCGHKEAALKLMQLLHMHNITDAMESLQT